MSKGRSEIIADIEAHIAANGGAFDAWYVGFTASPKQALFKIHKLRDKGDAWIARKARDETEAFDVVEFFRTVQKTQGKKGAAGEEDLFVYAYRTKPHTKP